MSREKERKTIMHADDKKTIREMMSTISKNYFRDYNFESFSNGGDLVKRLREGNEDIALLVLDNKMPILSGSQILATYGHSNLLESFPVLLYYGGDEEIGRQALEDGATRYILKPDFKELIGFMKEYLD